MDLIDDEHALEEIELLGSVLHAAARKTIRRRDGTWEGEVRP